MVAQQKYLFELQSSEYIKLKDEFDKTRRALFGRVSELQKENEWLETQLEVLISCFQENGLQNK